MTAPRPEIQRYRPSATNFCNGIRSSSPVGILDRDDNGAVVLYTDHLRAVTLAKIEVLESLPLRKDEEGTGKSYIDRFIQLKIAALRKEL